MIKTVDVSGRQGADFGSSIRWIGLGTEWHVLLTQTTRQANPTRVQANVAWHTAPMGFRRNNRFESDALAKALQ